MSTDALNLGQFATEIGRKRARGVAQLMALIESLPLSTLEQEDAKAKARDIINNLSDNIAALLPRLEPSGVPGEILDIVTEIHEAVVPQPVGAGTTD